MHTTSRNVSHLSSIWYDHNGEVTEKTEKRDYQVAFLAVEGDHASMEKAHMPTSSNMAPLDLEVPLFGSEIIRKPFNSGPCQKE